MNRRGFLKGGAGSALATGTLLSGLSSPKALGAEPAATALIPNLKQLSAEDHRARLKNIALCQNAIHGAMRTHLITDYLPGQCNYNLGEYPCRKVWEITDWDAAQLDQLKAEGIRLIQLHEDWNDSQRLYGATKYTPLNPKGFRRFLDLAHQRGMKVIVYASTGFIDRRDPDFREEWARDQDLVELFYQYARCSPASPSWRAYIVKQLMRIMDEYGVDGLFNDMGYIPLADNPAAPTRDEVLAFPESATRDGALGDLLALIYEEVKRRGGIVKAHYAATARPQTDLKVYDYIWVGETVDSIDSLRAAVKNHPPYVVPCLDFSRAKIPKEDEMYLQSIPYMQFPLLLGGRPVTGERASIPGIHYADDGKDFWTLRLRELWKYSQAHPNGPFNYGGWDSIPGRPEARKIYVEWLKLYAPMVEEGTWAWLQVTDTQLIRGPLPQDVVASVFANHDIYLVLANYGTTSASIDTVHSYRSMRTMAATDANHWDLEPRSLDILMMEQPGTGASDLHRAV
jgi:hypothetical protein